MRSRRRVVTVLGVAAVMLLAAGCGRDEAKAFAIARMPVQVTAVQVGQIEESIVATGTLEPLRRVSPATKITGRVTSLDFEEGQFVESGAEIVRILAADIQARQAQAQAGLAAAEAQLQRLGSTRAELEAVVANADAELKRAKNLYEKNTISKAELDRAEREFLVAKARLSGVDAERKEIEARMQMHRAQMKEAEVLLRYAVLQAPFSGYVTEKMLEVGDLATPGRAVLTLDDLSKVKAVGKVSETDIAKIKVGSAARLTVDALPGSEPKGAVSRIIWSGDPESRSFKVEVVVENRFDQERSPRFLPAMFVTMRVVTDRREATRLIPRTAVVERGPKRFVYRVTDGKAMWTEVELGLKDLEHYEVLRGLKEGDMVVTVGKENLTHEQAVRVVERAEPVPEREEQ